MNRKLNLPNLKRGDHVYTPLFGGVGSHHGVYVGNEEVIHLTVDGTPENKIRFSSGVGQYTIRKESLSKFSSNKPVEVFRRGGLFGFFHHPYPSEQVALRAESRVGDKGGYRLFGGLDSLIPFRGAKDVNCEHFATWCRTGQNFSDQVENAQNASVVGAGVAAGATLLGLAALIDYKIAYQIGYQTEKKRLTKE